MLTVGGWDCGVDFGMDAVAHAQMGDLGELLSENFWNLTRQSLHFSAFLAK